MRPVDRKAYRYVDDGRVTVDRATFDSDGGLIEAAGTVYGQHPYSVFIDPTRTTCSCQYGQARTDAAGHSHDLALRIAIGNQQH